jgi:hypothetical protein
MVYNSEQKEKTMAYFHTSIGYIDIENLYIPKELKNAKEHYFDNNEFVINVDGNNETSDPITFGIDLSGLLNCQNLSFDMGTEEAKLLADGIYQILKSRNL